MSEGTVARHALGQAAYLGSLYYALSANILSQNLFEQALAYEQVMTTSNKNTQWTFTQTNTLKEKFSALDLSRDLSASFLAGMVDVSGSGSWLSQDKSSARVTAASAIYTVLTKKQALDLTQKTLRDLLAADALQTESVSHVVCGIQWGARTIITTTSKASEARNPAIAQRILRSFEGGSAEDLEAVKELAKSFEFNISSDVPVDKKRTKAYDYDAVCQFLQTVTEVVGKSNSQKGFRLSYDLIPIADVAKALGLDDDYEWPTVEPVDESLSSQVGDCFDELCRAKQDMNDYIVDIEAHSACVPKEHILTANKQVKALESVAKFFKSELSSALERVRVPNADDSELVGFLTRYRMKLDRKCEPLSVIGNYVEKMAFADSIQLQANSNPKIHYVADDISSTDKLIKNAASGDVFVFYFDVAGIADPTWAANRDKTIELLGSGYSPVIVVDCDMGTTHRILGKPHIEQLRGGTVAIPDLVAEIQSLVDKSLLRPAKPQALLQPSENDPSQDRQRPVKVCCPRPNCAFNGEYEWICPTCKDAVLAGFTDDYLYCGCGKYRYTDAVFKCRNSGHGEDFAAYSDEAKLLAALKKLAPFEEFNILILGETGVGKSTFINAFINYLMYDSLTDAQKAPGLRSAIPCSFSYDEVKNGYVTRQVTVNVGKETDLEKMSTGGASATQNTVTYALNLNGKIVRLIDTPGIGDTRGLAKDYENVKDILETLESINRLSTILFLLKPNSARLTTTFNFCLTELLSHLHKDTSKNIVFGFTNARSTNYQLGDTRKPLEELLAGRKTGITELDRTKNLFFFDSESFRFLAAFKQEGTEMPDKHIYEQSWEKSAEEARRLVNAALTAPTHEVQKTLALNRTRATILNMTKPMIEQTNAITKTTNSIASMVNEINKCEKEGEDWKGRLEMEQVVPVRYDFKQPKTVCAHKDCRKPEYNSSSKETVTVYKTVCHDGCYIQVPDEQTELPELSQCAAFDGKGDLCNNSSCRHEWRIHLHITHEYKMQIEKIKNSAAVEALLESNNKKAAAEQQRKEAEARLIKLDADNSEIKKALATFGVYLNRSAIVTVNDSTKGYLEQLIKKAEFDQNNKDADRYREEIKAHESQCEEILKAIQDHPSEAPNERAISDIIIRLGNLPTVGESLRKNLGIKVEDDGSVAVPKHRSRPVKLKPSGTTRYNWMTENVAKVGHMLGY